MPHVIIDMSQSRSIRILILTGTNFFLKLIGTLYKYTWNSSLQ